MLISRAARSRRKRKRKMETVKVVYQVKGFEVFGVFETAAMPRAAAVKVLAHTSGFSMVATAWVAPVSSAGVIGTRAAA